MKAVTILQRDGEYRQLGPLKECLFRIQQINERMMDVDTRKETRQCIVFSNMIRVRQITIIVHHANQLLVISYTKSRSAKFKDELNMHLSSQTRISLAYRFFFLLIFLVSQENGGDLCTGFI